MYEQLGAAGGGLAGAQLGTLGRSPLLDLLKPLDYPRQALWNLVRGGGRMLQGEGSVDDILGMVPGLAGAGMAALGPLGMLGGALAGGAVQGLGKLTGSEAFEAATPQDVTGTEDFLPNLALGAATDPLTYAGLGLGHKAGGALERVPPLPAAFDPAAALTEFRQGVPQAGFELDAVRSGLGARNQALGEVVGDVAQARQAHAGHVADQLLIPEAPYGPAAIPDVPPLSPEQAFESMLPLANKEQRIRRAIAGDRNELPAGFEGLTTDQQQAYARRPARELAEDPYILGAPRAELEQLRRHVATQNALRTTQRQLEQHGPLVAELAKSGQLGPIESRLQANWATLGDMTQEGRLTPEQLAQHTRTAEMEDEAFRTLFEREPIESLHSELGKDALHAPLPEQTFPGATIGQLSGTQALPPLPEILAQHSANLGRPLQGGEAQQLEAALAGRDAPALHAQGLLQEPGPGLFAGNPAYPGQPYAGLGGPGPGPYRLPLGELDPAYTRAAGEVPLGGTHPLEDVGFTSNPFMQGGEADLGGMDLLPHELQNMVPQAAPPVPTAAVPPLPRGPLVAPPPPSLLPRGLHTGEPPLDWRPPPSRGVSLEAHTLHPEQYLSIPEVEEAIGKLIPGRSSNPNSVLGMQQIEEQLGRPLSQPERAYIAENYHSTESLAASRAEAEARARGQGPRRGGVL